MTLKEKFDNLDTFDPADIFSKLSHDSIECEKIANEFAIGFALWKEVIQQDDDGLYYGESRIQVSRKNPVDIHQLLEIYKKEKGL